METASKNLILSTFESRYRSQQLKQDQLNNSRGILLINLVSFLFVVTDYMTLSLSNLFYTLLIIRLSFFLISLLFYWQVRKEISFRKYSYLTLLWLILLALFNIATQVTMPSGYLINFGVEVAILASMTLYFRNTFKLQILASLIFILLTMSFNYIYKDYSTIDLTVMFICFLSFMCIGILTSSYIERVNRKLYSKIENESEMKNRLREAMAKIKQLKGLIPICSTCHKIKNEDGEWERLEKYIHNHSEARFSHSICKECTDIMLKEAEED
jgi:CDP-diglyceride synthetase